MTDKAPEQGKALEAVKAEAKGRKLADGSVIVPLVTDDGAVDITVPAPADWWEGAVEHLTAGRISEWVKLAVDEAEQVKWASARKRYRHLNDFLTAWTQATGEDPGESPGSSAS